MLAVFRDRLEALSQLYTCLDEGMLLSGGETTDTDPFPVSTVVYFVEYLPDEWEIQRDEVVLDGELGRGAFGLVYQGIWQNSQGQRPLDVAVKASCIGMTVFNCFLSTGSFTDIE